MGKIFLLTLFSLIDPPPYIGILFIFTMVYESFIFFYVRRVHIKNINSCEITQELPYFEVKIFFVLR